mgnify:CR=1 FL=1
MSLYFEIEELRDLSFSSCINRTKFFASYFSNCSDREDELPAAGFVMKSLVSFFDSLSEDLEEIDGILKELQDNLEKKGI